MTDGKTSNDNEMEKDEQEEIVLNPTEETETETEEAEETADAETADSDDETEAEDADEAAEYEPQFGELAGAAELSQGAAAAVVTKKKSKALPIVLIVVAAFVLMIAAVFVLAFTVLKDHSAVAYFKPNTVQGVWKFEGYFDPTTGKQIAEEEKKEDSIHNIMYYVFSENTLTIERGDQDFKKQEIHDCSFTEDEKGTKTINIMFEGQVAAQYTYTMEGNLFSGQKLNLTSGEETVTFTKELNVSLPKVEAMENFKADAKLTGKWYNKEIKFGYIFGEDGFLTVVNNSMGKVETRCAYRVEDGKITIKNSQSEEKEESIEFTYKDDNTIVISSMEFPKVTE